MTMAVVDTRPNQRAELERAPSRDLVLMAIIHGLARWEWFSCGDKTSGELCLDGIRHSCKVSGGNVSVGHGLRLRLIERLMLLSFHD